MSSYEIEIKSLLGDESNARSLIDRLHEMDPNTELREESSQLNHYFEGGDIQTLYIAVKDLFNEEAQKKLKHIVDDGMEFSIRTRLVNDTTLKFVIKASIGDDTSANGVSRIEFEEEVPEMTLEDLDQMIIDAGFEYQAKWSRQRKEYVCTDATVCVDRNAGYGYLAEFERVVDDPSMSSQVERELRDFMSTLGCDELPQDRLERMFEHYNKNWPEYYGTDRVFFIE